MFNFSGLGDVALAVERVRALVTELRQFIESNEGEAVANRLREVVYLAAKGYVREYEARDRTVLDDEQV